MEKKEIEELVEAGMKGLGPQVDGKVKDAKESIIKEITEKGYRTETEVKDAIEAAVKEAKESLEKEILEIKKASKKSSEPMKKSLHTALGEGMAQVKDDLSALKNGGKASVNIMLTKANEDLEPTNFTNDAYEIATTDRTRGLYESPFSPVWFRNLLPMGTTDGGTIQYLKENGDVGSAAVWDGTGAIGALTEKPGTAPLFDGVTESVIWIAGITRVKREMLDDIAWLQGYLARRLTTGRTGLWVAENTQIFNKLTANSVAYDGTKTIPIEIIYDAAFGQLRDNYYNPTTILMNSRDVVNLIALNKATGGSEEYNLPPGTVAIINGQLTIGGIPVIGAPNVPVDEYMIFDRNATEFVSRMSPEVRFFEQDRDNVPKNLVTVRAEERILPLVYDDNAVIHGTFTPTT